MWSGKVWVMTLQLDQAGAQSLNHHWPLVRLWGRHTPLYSADNNLTNEYSMWLKLFSEETFFDFKVSVPTGRYHILTSRKCSSFYQFNFLLFIIWKERNQKTTHKTHIFIYKKISCRMLLNWLFNDSNGVMTICSTCNLIYSLYNTRLYMSFSSLYYTQKSKN